ncbi:hypothetical protein DCS_05952 [Drechmeria coniospora]|uniref:Uncharacterized protein n=1 Tax=Drechmeria coniospora TaxID=98403 RepID=A0A151GA87_DRECN|nr:hypothetical protein DCS_05952 [Drechmeria coniospora]KYK54002.1 hypothetical protein DCS_05952 [Drechmeria coniospora]
MPRTNHAGYKCPFVPETDGIDWYAMRPGLGLHPGSRRHAWSWATGDDMADRLLPGTNAGDNSACKGRGLGNAWSRLAPSPPQGFGVELGVGNGSALRLSAARARRCAVKIGDGRREKPVPEPKKGHEDLDVSVVERARGRGAARRGNCPLHSRHHASYDGC